MIRTFLTSAAAVATLMMIAPQAQAQDARAQAKRILAKFDKEPSVIDVQRAAAKYAHVNPGAYDSWITQANVANALPRRLRGMIRSTTEDQRDVRTTSSGTGSLSDLVSEDDDLRLELRVEWDLSRLIFNPDKIRAARQVERLINQREDILTTVNKLFFARRQLQVEQEINPPESVQKALRAQLRIDGLTADLDALTGGWFSEEMRRTGVAAR